MDFAQSRSLPMGPEEGGSWWYCGARLQVTVLGFYVWGVDFDKPVYYTYLSDVMDHTPLFVIACMKDWLAKLPDEHVESYSLWADVGPHFRAYRFWSWWLDVFPREVRKPVFLDYFVEGHGKGVLDGMFGRMSKWTEQIARKEVLPTVSELCCALARRADQMNGQHGRSLYTFVDFAPLAHAELPHRLLSGTSMRDRKMGCRSTYSLSTTLSRLNHAIIHSHVLTGRPVVASTPPPYCDGDREEEEEVQELDGIPNVCGTDGWRRAYRMRVPEKAGPRLGMVRKTFDVQHLPDIEWSSRTRPWAERCSAFRRTAAHQKGASSMFRRSLREQLEASPHVGSPCGESESDDGCESSSSEGAASSSS